MAAPAIDTHLQKCAHCTTSYAKLPASTQNCISTVLKLHVLNQIRNEINYKKEIVPNSLLHEIQITQTLAQIETVNIPLKDRIICHQIAECSLDSYEWEALNALSYKAS